MDEIRDILKKSTAIILVGGKSSRMNYIDKYNLKIGNLKFIDFILNEISCFESISISCNKNQDLQDFKYDYIIDKIDSIGPIGGMYSSMTEVSSELLFFCSCDMPYINKILIKKLYLNYNNCYDCVIPCINDNIYPLFGIYNKRIKSIIKDNIDKKDYKIKSILNKVNTKYVIFEEKYILNFANINTPKDYNEYCNIK